MKVRLLAVGTKMPAWVSTGFAEYSKRLPQDFRLELTELPLGHRGKSSDPKRAIRAEGDSMLGAINSDERVIALCVDGRAWSTEQLSSQIEHWRMEGQNVSLLVGGPEGLDPRCVAAADQRWSLSPLTLPHPLVRVLLAEQLYRAWSLMNGHPYHK